MVKVTLVSLAMGLFHPGMNPWDYAHFERLSRNGLTCAAHTVYNTQLGPPNREKLK